jgi:hypothetical protein
LQIAIQGEYNGILQEGVHYVPLATDCSNVVEVVRILRDAKLATSITRTCKAAILSVDGLRANFFARALIEQIKNGCTVKALKGTDPCVMTEYVQRYQDEVLDNANSFWQKKRYIEKIKQTAIIFGARKIKKYYSMLGLRKK